MRTQKQARRIILWPLFLIVAIFTAFLSLPATSYSCTVPPEECNPDVWVKFDPNDRTKVWITFHDFVTARAVEGQDCGCGISLPFEVISAEIVGADGSDIGFGPFEIDDEIRKIFEDVTPTDEVWAGLIAQTTQDIKAGVPVDLTFHIMVPEGTTFDEIAAELTSNGFVGVVEVGQGLAPAVCSGATFGIVLQCIRTVTIENPVVSPGDMLNFEFYLQHNRPQTVHASFSTWIEDENGVPVKVLPQSPELELEYGKEITKSKSVRIPRDLAPGIYRLVSSIDQMAQGIAQKSATFTVVE